MNKKGNYIFSPWNASCSIVSSDYPPSQKTPPVRAGGNKKTNWWNLHGSCRPSGLCWCFLKAVLRKREPFGGLQMVFIGNMYQLPPVLTRQDKEHFKTVYESPYFFSSQSKPKTLAKQYPQIKAWKGNPGLILSC